ncbi:hypothetical protein LTR49_021808 [Elasticomyces elasticus]|nr:hypothetical protein LTR49_021808 [Elasticomyces elasticus]
MLLGHSVCAGLLGWIAADPDSALKAVQNIVYTNPGTTTLSVPIYSSSSAAGLAITTYTPWTSRLSYGIMATMGFLTNPESAHNAFQKVLDPNHTKSVVTAQTSPSSALDSTAAASTAATPISVTTGAPHVASASTSLTFISLITEAPHAELASSAPKTPTLITGNPGTVTHIMDFEADATPIVPEFRTAQRSKLHTSTRFESDADSETSPRMEYWPGYLDILTPFPYPGALYALFFAALFLAVVLVLLYSLRAPTHPEMMEALKLERTARKYAEKQLTLEKQARKRAETALALLDENRQHGSSRPHEVETLKADLKAARTTSSDRRAALQKCWLQIEELTQQIELNEVSYKSKMRSKDAELKNLLKKISQSEVASTTPLEDDTTRHESTERDAVAAGENGNDESANIRTTRPSSPQTTSESLHDEESNEDSTAKQAAAPGTYGDDENTSQDEPLPKDDIDDTTTTSNGALASSGYGSGESATDDSTIPQAGQDDDDPLRDANTANDTTANEAPAPAEYGDDGSVSDHGTIPSANGDDMPVTQSTEALAGTGVDESVRDHSTIPLADSDNTHATQSVGAPAGAGSDGTVRDHGTIPQATGDITHIPQSIGALTETRGGAMTPASGSFTVQTQTLPTASSFPAAKVQLQIKRRQKQMSSPLRPNSAKTGIRKKNFEKPVRKLEQHVGIPLLQQYHEQPVPNATAVGGYGGGEMTMGELEHFPPPPQHQEQLLPMAAAPGLRGDAEIEPPAEQVVDDMAVDVEPVVAAEEQPVEMELDGEGGEQMKVDGEGQEQMKVGGEGGEQMEVDGDDGPAADQQDGIGRDVDNEATVAHQQPINIQPPGKQEDEATVAHQQPINIQPPVRLAQLSFAQQGKQEDEATVAHQQPINVQPPVRLAQLSFAQQGKQARMERARKAIAEARDMLMAAKEEKEVNGSKWSNVETIRYDAKLRKLRMDFNNKKDGFKFVYYEDALGA